MPLHHRAPRSALAALLLGAVTACAPAGVQSPRSETLLTHTPSPPGRECRPAAAPDVLPAVDALVDSAMLGADLLALAGPEGARGGYAVLSLEFDRNGWNSRRSVIEHTLVPAVADSLQRLVFARRREVTPGEPFGVRLRVELGDGPWFRVGRQEVCAARVLDSSELALGEGIWSARRAEPPLPGWNAVRVRVLVDERGAIADAHVEHSPVSIRSEAPLLNLLHSLSFEPALVDGAPVSSWMRVSIPIRGWRSGRR